MRSFSHLEVINANKTPGSEAADSQVSESARTWNYKLIIIKTMRFQVCTVSHTWKS